MRRTPSVKHGRRRDPPPHTKITKKTKKTNKIFSAEGRKKSKNKVAFFRANRTFGQKTCHEK